MYTLECWSIVLTFPLDEMGAFPRFPGVQELTMGMVSSWCKAVTEKGSLPKLILLLKAYRLACTYGDDEDDEDRQDKMALFTSSSVYSKVLVFVLKEADTAFRKILGVETRERPSFGDCQRSKRWGFSLFVEVGALLTIKWSHKAGRECGHS